eukprot:TRINITY_DN17397_c0_g1_i1.p1 TRINITY_DN17397_c0_g1~~TRINITY_DN17397_c0_g1_i1.p1  ORF type:complete len:252 (+),score=70.25 TRINITY_DN17397_c0_g1_i1:46-801(+)
MTNQAHMKISSVIVTVFVIIFTSFVCGNETRSGRQFLFDIGTNNGKSVQYFFRPGGPSDIQKLSPGVINDRSHLRGICRTGDWTVVAVEANPRFGPMIEQVKKDILAEMKVARFDVFNPIAITSDDTNVTLYLDSPEGNLGSSIIEQRKGNRKNAVSVKGISIKTLFETVGLTENDYVVIKMDVEGAEYDVLRSILAHGLLRYIDVFAIEWHEDNPHLFGKVPELKAKFTTQRNTLEWIMLKSNTILTNWI